MKNNQTSRAFLPECLESPSGSSFGSLETLGVAHPTKENKETLIRTNVGKKILKKKGKKVRSDAQAPSSHQKWNLVHLALT